MFGVSFGELMVIGVLALLVVGPERLPGLARSLGRWLGQLRQMADGVRHEFQREIHNAEIMALEAELKAETAELARLVPEVVESDVPLPVADLKPADDDIRNLPSSPS
jgi:sec-independent protein translocase protein TatB